MRNDSQRQRHLSLCAVGLLTLAWLAGPVRAEVLVFQRGGAIEAPASIEDDRVSIDTPAGRFNFPRSDFRVVVPGHDPRREWPARREAALQASPRDGFAAAWWALERGLVAESAEMIRQAHAREPDNRLYARLVARLDAHERPIPDPDTARLESALGVDLRATRSPHVLLLHQHDEREAEERVATLERVVRAFDLWLTALDVDIDLPRARLVSVHLRDQDDYVRFLTSQNAGAMRNTLGYFHPTFRAVVTFDTRALPRWRGHAASPPEERSGMPAVRDLRRKWLLEELDRRAYDLGTAIHEMIHLEVVASGLASPAAPFPLWLHEGLAMQFETVRGGRWAGFGPVNDLRLADWHALTRPSEILPILEDAGFGHGYRRDVYARCWSLVYYLRSTRPTQFVTLLDRYRLPRTPDTPPSRSLFLAALGDDTPSLESDWNHWMNARQTPIQEAIAVETATPPATSTRDRD